MKHYIDIENIREEDVILMSGMTRESNCKGFEPGDHITITTKIDGTNGSIEYNPESNSLIAYSRKNELNAMNTNQGFWNYVQTLHPEDFKDEPNLMPFGEWLIKNKVRYEDDAYRHFYVFDVWNKDTERWMTQDFVKKYCERHGFEMVPELYNGPFISWEHCKSFMSHHWRSLGEEEGVVVKSDYRIGDGKNRMPAYLKLVNSSFKESMKIKVKEVDPSKEADKKKAEELMSQIVTQNRVEKELLKMRNEGILPSELTPKEMALVAHSLPKRIWEDCMKEEHEICMAAGEYAGKTCSALVMKIAKHIILGE